MLSTCKTCVYSSMIAVVYIIHFKQYIKNFYTFNNLFFSNGYKKVLHSEDLLFGQV